MTTTLPPRVPCKTFSLPGNTLLTDEALNLLHDMLTNLPPHELRNTLLELYHNYVRHEHDNLPTHFDEMVTHFYCLDNFFKALCRHSSTRSPATPAAACFVINAMWIAVGYQL